MPRNQRQLAVAEGGGSKRVAPKAVASLGGWRTLVSPLAERKRREAAIMGIVAVSGIYAVRLGYEPVLQLAVESGLVLAALSLGIFIQSRISRAEECDMNRHLLRMTAVAVLAISVPVGIRLTLKMNGTAPAWEMVWLTSFGVAAISLALFAWRDRDVGLSVISSGFLVLFAAGSADTPVAVWLAIVWAMICLWWLVANHWERLDQCMSYSVRRMPMLRLGTTLGGLGLAATTALLVWGQVGESARLSWGFMPTSGGDSYSDGTSRSGVGDGEAIVAAEEHAASFGAVDSDIFMDSDQPSLFDMFDDTIGEPFRPKKYERAIALQQREVIEPNSKPGESGRGGQSFPITRQRTKQPTQSHADDKNTVLRWIGNSGAHLAMERFTVFDGRNWKPSAADYSRSLQRREIKERIWFFLRRDIASGLYRHTYQQAVKVMRLESARIPVPSEIAGVSIKDVDRGDFFGVADDGSLTMPGRSSIPRQTNIRLVSWGVDEGAVNAVENFAEANLDPADVQYRSTVEVSASANEQADRTVRLSGVERFEQLAAELFSATDRDWKAVKQVVKWLRNEFTFDRQIETASSDPLLQFYRSRRGGDHMFATAASVMLRSLGYETRLVTGFYADPQRYNSVERETEIVPEDVHVWLEVHVASDLWLPLEPTPGYLEPSLNQSFLYKLASLGYRAAPAAAVLLGASLVVWFCRAFWGEYVCVLIWYLSRFFSARRRLRIWSAILDIRCWLARRPRPSGVAQRRWLQQMCESNSEMATKIKVCFDELDAIVFGDRPLLRSYWSGGANELMHRLNVKFMKRSRQEIR